MKFAFQNLLNALILSVKYMFTVDIHLQFLTKSSMSDTLQKFNVKFCLSSFDIKVKYFMTRSLPVENLLPQNVGLIINYLR